MRAFQWQGFNRWFQKSLRPCVWTKVALSFEGLYVNTCKKGMGKTDSSIKIKTVVQYIIVDLKHLKL